MKPPPFVYPVRFGTAPPGEAGALVQGSLAILFDPDQVTLTYDADVISTGDGASITGAVRIDVTNGAIRGAATTTDDTTATPLLEVPIPTGSACWVRFTFTGEIKTGGDAGKRLAAETRFLLRNPTGTPTASPGTMTPAPLVGCNETGGALGGSNLQGPAFSANLLTLSVKGIAATTVLWAAVAEPLYFPE